MNLPDVQRQPAEIPIKLKRVGVTNVEKHLTVQRETHTYQFAVSMDMFSELSDSLRGAHLSRWLEILDDIPEVTPSIEHYAILVAEEGKKRHRAEVEIYIQSKFPYWVVRPSGKNEKQMFDLYIEYNTLDKYLSLGVRVTGMTYCPCCKELLNGPSHNQRATVVVFLDFRVGETTIRAGELVDLINRCFSSPVFSTLKREEEKQLVYTAMSNAKFAEDVCREVVVALKHDIRLKDRDAVVKIESFESVHPHNVTVEWEGVL